MPSNFDANYCYSLGYMAGCLIDQMKTGYISTVRHLDQHVTMWQPAGVPFTRVMEVKEASDGSTFPAVTRQLVDLEGPLFKVLCEVIFLTRGFILPAKSPVWLIPQFLLCHGN